MAGFVQVSVAGGEEGRGQANEVRGCQLSNLVAKLELIVVVYARSLECDLSMPSLSTAPV